MKIIIFLSACVLFSCSFPKNEGKPEEKVPEVEDMKADEDVVFIDYEVMPEFRGGMEALMKFVRDNIHYPDSAWMNGIEGRVFVSFIIDTEGKVTAPKVIKSVHPLLDEEALRIVRMLPDFIPGRNGDEPVPITFTLPFLFRLNEVKDEIKAD